ncbi:hypothetical protein WMF31_05125 [Sorangium sp. So ce1036]|uniref:hypothetical protein n=1 Tax=Sorangium sp. So ce1036 TaxID=3133328 RepID=UPI003EFCB937
MRLSTLLYATAASVTATACGASINAVYEGDVRFEHCMALDARSDVKPTLRRACWEEWLQFYTFGQTRDRVEHATLRQRQLSRASDFDEGEWNPPSSRAPSAVPEPTSALAPPPMLLTADVTMPAQEADAGAPDAGAPEEPSAAPADTAPPGAACSAACEQSWSGCRKDCTSAGCEKGCSGKYRRCMRRCF